MVSARKVDGGQAHSLLGFWRFDPETRLAHADEKVCQAFGVPAADRTSGN